MKTELMTSKERVHLALQRRPVDRVPIFMWYHPQTRRRLGGLLEIPAEYVSSVMGDDIRQAWVSNNHAMEGIVHERDGQSHMDDWGVEWTRIDGFNQISKYPLSNAGEEQLLQYRFPFERVDPLVDLLKPAMKFATDYFVGIDVLNPIQCNCPGMNPLELKREFGRELAFMGGVDTQGVLPHGTADQVRRATAELLEGMSADGGGYILAASHTVPPETPDENIFAMYDEAGITTEEIFDKAAGVRESLRRQHP